MVTTATRSTRTVNDTTGEYTYTCANGTVVDIYPGETPHVSIVPCRHRTPDDPSHEVEVEGYPHAVIYIRSPDGTLHTYESVPPAWETAESLCNEDASELGIADLLADPEYPRIENGYEDSLDPAVVADIRTAVDTAYNDYESAVADAIVEHVRDTYPQDSYRFVTYHSGGYSNCFSAYAIANDQWGDATRALDEREQRGYPNDYWQEHSLDDIERDIRRWVHLTEWAPNDEHESILREQSESYVSGLGITEWSPDRDD